MIRRQKVPSDTEVLAAYPNIAIDRDTVSHYRGWLGRRLLINRCDECGRWHHPARAICPSCWSDAVVPTEVSGRGTIYLLTVLHIGTPTPDADLEVGYPLAAIELDEEAGLRCTAGLLGRPSDLRIGQQVELTWINRGSSPVPAFRQVGR